MAHRRNKCATNSCNIIPKKSIPELKKYLQSSIAYAQKIREYLHGELIIAEAIECKTSALEHVGSFSIKLIEDQGSDLENTAKPLLYIRHPRLNLILQRPRRLNLIFPYHRKTKNAKLLQPRSSLLSSIKLIILQTLITANYLLVFTKGSCPPGARKLLIKRLQFE
uniref:Uncharacterized protein n=1 Tax=Glossina brevipalpis TaxID=37001 RepID=A0A1A9WUF0_9MUSC